MSGPDASLVRRGWTLRPGGWVSQAKNLRELADHYGLAHPGGAWIASEPDEGDYHRRAGFRAAGRLLLTTAAGSRADEQLIWPALAVYRHFYELQLK
jgi:hypothetical protein